MTTAQVQLFDRLVGTWTTEGTHPMVPGVVLHGTTTVEWLEGEKFLIIRSQIDHPDFPTAISIIGDMKTDRIDDKGGAKSTSDGSLRMHYFDSRGVFRDYDASIDEVAWRWWRDTPGFSQRFTGTFSDGGDTIIGLSQLRRDDVNWIDDLRVTYRRQR
jgi:hypothetical protein